ncbi:MAG: signal peptidase I [Actinomycetota bacterium]
MADLTVVVDLETRVACRESLAASVPDAESARWRVVRFVQVGDEIHPAAGDGASDARWSWLRQGISAAGLFVAVISACVGFLALAPTAIGYRPVAVTSASMAPAIRTGDVVVMTPAPDWLPVGAVIEFGSDDRRVMHRVVEVTTAGYRTKGDANRSPDGFEVPVDQVDGVGVMVVPLAGWPVVLAEDGRWPELVGLVAVLVGAGAVSNRAWGVPPVTAADGR